MIGSTRGAEEGAAGWGGGWDVVSRPGLGPRMVVRATRRIVPGEEVLVNYLGRAALAPADERRADLASTWGFECRCPRCAAELTVNLLVRERISMTAMRAAELAPEVAEAAAAGDRKVLEAASSELLRLLGRVEDACDQAGVPPYQVRLRNSSVELHARNVVGMQCDRLPAVLASWSDHGKPTFPSRNARCWPHATRRGTCWRRRAWRSSRG